MTTHELNYDLRQKIESKMERVKNAQFEAARVSREVRKEKAADDRFRSVVRPHIPDAFYFCQNERCVYNQEVHAPDDLAWVETEMAFWCRRCRVGMMFTEFSATLEDILEVDKS